MSRASLIPLLTELLSSQLREKEKKNTDINNGVMENSVIEHVSILCICYVKMHAFQCHMQMKLMNAHFGTK